MQMHKGRSAAEPPGSSATAEVLVRSPAGFRLAKPAGPLLPSVALSDQRTLGGHRSWTLANINRIDSVAQRLFRNAERGVGRRLGP